MTRSIDPSLSAYASKRLDELADHGLVRCKICSSETHLLDVVDFSATCNNPRMQENAVGVPVYYQQCVKCDFIFTVFFDKLEGNQWSELVYNKEYYETVDPDYAERRPIGNLSAVDTLLGRQYDRWIGLDYGGGNGHTAALLRKGGYRYECYDPFGLTDVSESLKGQYNFCSVFEVAEHSPDPIKMMRDIVGLCSPGRLAILIGTHVSDGHILAGQRLSWWYASPRNGHVSLYSKAALAALAEQFGLAVCSVSETSHLLTRGYSNREARAFLLKGKVRNRLRRLIGR